MKLELGCVQINDIQFASESKVENGTIYVNAEELKALLLEDGKLIPRRYFQGGDSGTRKDQRIKGFRSCYHR